jgi:hypothetical protein
MMRVTWIEYKGKKILFEDYTNLKGDELLKVLYETEAEYKKTKQPVLALVDYTGCHANQKYMDELKRIGKQYGDLVLKSANVGIVGIQKVLAKSYIVFTGQGNKTKFFNTIEEAKDFLVE